LLKKVPIHLKIVIVSLPIYSKELYLNIQYCLILLIILLFKIVTVSTSTPEHKLLYLKRLKTYHRNSIKVVYIINYLLIAKYVSYFIIEIDN